MNQWIKRKITHLTQLVLLRLWQFVSIAAFLMSYDPFSTDGGLAQKQGWQSLFGALECHLIVAAQSIFSEPHAWKQIQVWFFFATKYFENITLRYLIYI